MKQSVWRRCLGAAAFLGACYQQRVLPIGTTKGWSADAVTALRHNEQLILGKRLNKFFADRATPIVPVATFAVYPVGLSPTHSYVIILPNEACVQDCTFVIQPRCIAGGFFLRRKKAGQLTIREMRQFMRYMPPLQKDSVK